MPARLIVEAGTASPSVCELSPKSLTSIGRQSKSTIVLRDKHASRDHAEVFCLDNRWYLRDRGTTNGTWLNGQRVRDTAALEHFAQIRIGEIHLRFRADQMDVTPPFGIDLTNESEMSADEDSTALHVDELSALVHFLNNSLKETSPRGLLKLALEVVHGRTGATHCGFLSLDPNDPFPRVVVPEQAAVDSRLSKHLTNLALASNNAVWLARVQGQPLESESLADFSDAICIPLRGSGSGNRDAKTGLRTPLGALHVYKTNHAFTEHQFHFCEVLAGSLASTLQVLRSRRALEADNSRLSYRAPNQGDELVGASPVIQKLKSQISKLAERPRVVLIVGESGVGKELVALGLHRESSRCDGPLVPVNCASIVASMPEAELFGHEAGAFTNATRARPGHFQLADEGTLFLDEIGELSLDCQAKLLRVIETSKFKPVGADALVTVDVRIIAATNRDLEKEVGEGRFRQDLFYRLGTNISVPPLREHAEDIPALAEHFLKKLNAIHHRQVRLSDAALERLVSASWPGNVRQLRTVLETAVAMAEDDEVQVNQLFLGREMPPEDRPATLNLNELEKWAIGEALRETNANKAAAARLLGIHRETLAAKMKN